MITNKPSTSHEGNTFQWRYLHPRYWIIWFGIGLTILPTLLPYFVIVKLGEWLGYLLYLTGVRRVSIARVNLEKCFPLMDESKREELLKDNFKSVGIGVMEVAMAWWWPKKLLERKVCFEGLEQFERPRGIVLMIIHFTSIELAGRMITLRHSIDATYRSHGNPVFEFIQCRLRLRFDPSSKLIDRLDARSMLRSLRLGRTVWYAPDQDYGVKHSIFVPFFGVQAATVTGTSKLAKIGRADVIPMVMTRLPQCRGYKVRLYEALKNFPSGNDYKDAEQINNFIESRIREHPEQYMWLHRRFKSRPKGEKDFYR